MLGAGRFLSSDKEEFNPIRIPDLVGWWDFTDPTALWANAGRTTRISDGDTIDVADNKAFWNVPSSVPASKRDLALGSFVQAQSSARPTWYDKTNPDGPYADFGGSQVMYANVLKGNVAPGVMSEAIVNTQNITWFVVLKSHEYAAQPLTDLFYTEVWDGAGDPTSTDMFIIRLATDEHLEFFAGDRSDKSGDVILDSTADLANAFEIWTGIMKPASSANSEIYKRRNKNLGATNLQSKNHNYDFAAGGTSQATNYTSIGGSLPNTMNFDGHLKEIIFYNRTLTQEEVSSVEYYLAYKHKISI
tara:strand:+ start:712 stop:1620 length:909 start_codon:yes stop_codon:yes gene_type:complete